MTPRSTTYDVLVGFDRIRWNDDDATLREIYPGARELARYEGRDPLTGKTFVTPPGFVLEPGTFGMPLDLGGVFVYASVRFDEHRLAQIDLVADGGDERHAEASADEWQRVIARCAAALGSALGSGPVSPDEIDQRWTIGDVDVALHLEHARFRFTLEKRRS